LASIQSIQTIGQTFVQIQSVSSTNNYALTLIQEKLAVHGNVFFAFEQTEGKGQRGKQWVSEPGSNIILSVVMDTSFFMIQHQFSFSAMVANAVYDFFSKYAGDETSIKWPNDLYWRDRKAGGILIENSITSHQTSGGSWHWAVVGIGININQTVFSHYAVNPVSLRQITGKTFDVIALAKELCFCLEDRYQQLKNNKDNDLIHLYNERLFKKGSIVKLKKNNIAFTCTIEGVNEQGELLVSGATEDSFTFGEVEWVL